MKKKVPAAVIVLIIAALSVGGGYLFDRLAHTRELKTHPREYAEEVTALSYEYGVPTEVIYSAVKLRSGFNAGLCSEDGRIGLLQLTKEQYYTLSEFLGGPSDPGLLYEPATNLRLGTLWISSLYEKYGRWSCVWAAMAAGEETVDRWLRDPALLDDQGMLMTIPDPDAAEFAGRMDRAVAKYRELYGFSDAAQTAGTDGPA